MVTAHAHKGGVREKFEGRNEEGEGRKKGVGRKIGGGQFCVQNCQINLSPPKNAPPEMAQEERKKALKKYFLAHMD